MPQREKKPRPAKEEEKAGQPKKRGGKPAGKPSKEQRRVPGQSPQDYTG